MVKTLSELASTLVGALVVMALRWPITVPAQRTSNAVSTLPVLAAPSDIVKSPVLVVLEGSSLSTLPFHVLMPFRFLNVSNIESNLIII
jgi:hypothetical protein